MNIGTQLHDEENKSKVIVKESKGGEGYMEGKLTWVEGERHREGWEGEGLRGRMTKLHATQQ